MVPLILKEVKSNSRSPKVTGSVFLGVSPNLIHFLLTDGLPYLSGGVIPPDVLYDQWNYEGCIKNRLLQFHLEGLAEIFLNKVHEVRIVGGARPSGRAFLRSHIFEGREDEVGVPARK